MIPVPSVVNNRFSGFGFMHFVHPTGRPGGRYLHFVPVRAASDAPMAEAVDFRPVFQQLVQDVVKWTSF